MSLRQFVADKFLTHAMAEAEANDVNNNEDPEDPLDRMRACCTAFTRLTTNQINYWIEHKCNTCAHVVQHLPDLQQMK